jgi:hypothetical protein
VVIAGSSVMVGFATANLIGDGLSLRVGIDLLAGDQGRQCAGQSLPSC